MSQGAAGLARSSRWVSELREGPIGRVSWREAEAREGSGATGRASGATGMACGWVGLG
jgi:hypothetical protein